ncbi:RelA/SpoT domain-containing protein [Pseudoalteromonas sp. MMG024]|uniref:GTP pyrophosphokinase n=1 Tax=Pseudoalteromonas sp. MMG024 TaxID=2909980 RepID=UPI001F1B5845|nr:RelA/SpoT domain-containing protein [Pseudoalteromonas sp. MMG024]MCF6459154.1 RelA/SpoT domain-containing protein [Pseudoalteromonas sp. MMG024]
MNQKQFIEQYEKDKPMYKTWAKHVLEEINSQLKKHLVSEKAYSDFVKIPPSYRVKNTDSLVTKAFVRHASYYSNPYQEITDKAAIRFVVLLTSQLTEVSEIVENTNTWRFEKSKEFDDWKDNDPRMFDYQSVHYVVYCNEELDIEGCIVRKGTPCEVQIRTLMQHAYAELAHDTIYKSHIKAEPEVIRSFAKSMALMETTDELLCEAKNILESASSYIESWKAAVQLEAKNRLADVALVDNDLNSEYLLDCFSSILEKTDIESFQSFLADETYSYIPDKIKQHSLHFVEFRQDVILLIYFLARRFRKSFHRLWPSDKKPLESVYSDLGLSAPWQTT